MKIKKILPITTVLAATAVVAPIATSCAQPTKGFASWSYTDGLYNFTQNKAEVGTEKFNNENATKLYFEAENCASLLAEDIVWKISNNASSIVFDIDLRFMELGNYEFRLVPLSATVTVTKTSYDSTHKYGVASFNVAYKGYADIYNMADPTKPLLIAHTYANGDVNFTDIILYVNYNTNESTEYTIPCWNISNTYYEHATPSCLDTSLVNFKMNVPAEACTYELKYDKNYFGFIPMTDILLPASQLVNAMAPIYSHYLADVEYKA